MHCGNSENTSFQNLVKRIDIEVAVLNDCWRIECKSLPLQIKLSTENLLPRRFFLQIQDFLFGNVLKRFFHYAETKLLLNLGNYFNQFSNVRIYVKRFFVFCLNSILKYADGLGSFDWFNLSIRTVSFIRVAGKIVSFENLIDGMISNWFWFVGLILQENLCGKLSVG